MGKKNRDEMFTGKNPELSHFRIFGCLAYCHVPKEKRTKLDVISEKEIFGSSIEENNGEKGC